MKVLNYVLLSLLGFALSNINCKAEKNHGDYWTLNECIQGNLNNAYSKLGIYQWYQKNDQWYSKLLWYSKYAYNHYTYEDASEKRLIYFIFLNEDDYIKTKDAWQRELPEYVLRRMYFYDKCLEIQFLEWNNNNCEDRRNIQNIAFDEMSYEDLEGAKQDFPNAEELSR